MHLDELLHTVQYVIDNEGNRQAVQLDLDVWQALLQHLEFNAGHQVDDEHQAAMRREEAAYQEMHEELYKKYPGQHVAIFQGELVDRDEDGVALYMRVRQEYPGEFVLMTPVRQEAEETYRILSPQLVVEE
jgi:hypothetical protein